jgi:hypothetical protein
MKYLKDRVLLGLIGLLMLTVTLFLAGILPYPFGILVLLIFSWRAFFTGYEAGR